MSSGASVNTADIALDPPWMLACLLTIAVLLCLWVTWSLPFSRGWRITLGIIELLYAFAIGYLWWRTRPRRLLLKPGGRMSLWFPGGQRLDTQVAPGATVHSMYVVFSLPRRVGPGRSILISQEMADKDAFRCLRRWLRTLPAPADNNAGTAV